MKILFRFLFLFALVMANVALAQSVTQDQLQSVAAEDDWTKWNIFGLNAVVVLRVLGEIYAALKNGGGLVGIWRAIIYGQNVPKPIAQDYKHELKGQPDPLADLKAQKSPGD